MKDPNALLAPCACTPVAGALPGGSRSCLGVCRAQGSFQLPVTESSGLSPTACSLRALVSLAEVVTSQPGGFGDLGGLNVMPFFTALLRQVVYTLH